MQTGSMLAKWKAEELDLCRPLSPEKEEAKLKKTPHELLIEDGRCVGHAAFRRLGSCIELSTVVIDPLFRGKGRSHLLLHASITRWRQDRILHGSSVQPPVDLAAAIRGEKVKDKVWRKHMICFTRHPSLAAALIAAGFQHSQPRRRWWSLWLMKHPNGELSTRTYWALILNRLLLNLPILLFGEPLPSAAKRPGLIRLWFQRRRRIFHQLSHLSHYCLFILSADAPFTTRPQSDAEDMQERLQAMGLDVSIHAHARPEGSSEEDLEAWDEGRKDETPFVDLTEEE